MFNHFIKLILLISIHMEVISEFVRIFRPNLRVATPLFYNFGGWGADLGPISIIFSDHEGVRAEHWNFVHNYLLCWCYQSKILVDFTVFTGNPSFTLIIPM